MNEIVSAACRLVGADDGVRGVHIVAPGRPTFDELSQYQETAQASRVRLTVSGNGHITVRPVQRQGVTARPCHPEERGVSSRHDTVVEIAVRRSSK